MVSIFWINFNSYSFINVVLESLQGVLDLDYSNYELVIVDNGSMDGSFKVVKDFVEKKMSKIAVKIIELSCNTGFTGGNNVAYRARSQKSKYIVFLNNDAISYPNSLKRLIEFIERDPSLGSIDGVLLTYDKRAIGSAGNFISEIFTNHSLTSLPSKSNYIVFADGAYSIHRISSIKRAVGRDDSIFDDCMFAYYDDNVLGLKMWNTGSKVISIPIITGRHKLSSSFGRIGAKQAYLSWRGQATLNEISKSRYKELTKLFFYGLYITTMVERRILYRSQNLKELSAGILIGLKDGTFIGKEKRVLGESIDIYKSPIAKLSLSLIISLIPGIRLSRRITTKLDKQVIKTIK